MAEFSGEKAVTPFLKWAGGKRWLASSLVPLLENSEGTYFEPFLGGGAVFFACAPESALLSDLNSDLIGVFRAVRDDVEAVIERLSSLTISPDEYHRIRKARPSNPFQQAAYFIYLNRAAFNGLYRVNQKGEFNVPFGSKPGTLLCDAPLLRGASVSLRGVEMRGEDFRTSLSRVKAGDVVFVDPPYIKNSSAHGFRRYNRQVFTWSDQLDLAQICNDLAAQGARVVVTNTHSSDVLSLYDDVLFRSWSLLRMSQMAARIDRRRPAHELLLVSSSISTDPRGMGRFEMTPNLRKNVLK